MDVGSSKRQALQIYKGGRPSDSFRYGFTILSEDGSCRHVGRDGVLRLRFQDSRVPRCIGKGPTNWGLLGRPHDPCSTSTRSGQGPWLVAPLLDQERICRLFSTSRRPCVF